MPENEPIYAYRYVFCILLGKHENELNSPERQSVFKTCTGMHGITSTNAICFHFFRLHFSLLSQLLN